MYIWNKIISLESLRDRGEYTREISEYFIDRPRTNQIRHGKGFLSRTSLFESLREIARGEMRNNVTRHSIVAKYARDRLAGTGSAFDRRRHVIASRRCTAPCNQAIISIERPTTPTGLTLTDPDFEIPRNALNSRLSIGIILKLSFLKVLKTIIVNNNSQSISSPTDLNKTSIFLFSFSQTSSNSSKRRSKRNAISTAKKGISIDNSRIICGFARRGKTRSCLVGSRRTVFIAVCIRGV